MEIIGNGSIQQMDPRKTRARCRKWELRVQTPQGRKTKRITGSLATAKQALDQFMTDLINDNYVKNNIKFIEYSNTWLDYRKSTKNFSPNTLNENRTSLNRLQDVFGDIPLISFNPELIRNTFINIPSKANPKTQVSNTYKRKMFSHLNSIMDMAVTDGYLQTNPCNKVMSPKNDTKKRKAISYRELCYIIDCINKEPLNGRRIAINLICMLGLRRSEAVGVFWEDFDEENHSLFINRAYKEGDGTIDKPKSEAGNRYLPLTESLYNLLLEWKKVCDSSKFKPTTICCNTQGGILQSQNLYAYWSEMKVKYDFPNVTLHDLRHANLTYLSKNLDNFDLQYFAGWSSLEPAKIYIHRGRDTIKKALKNVDFK